MKMPATFSEAFMQAELDYRRERLNGVVARQPRVHRPTVRRRWRRGSAPRRSHAGQHAGEHAADPDCTGLPADPRRHSALRQKTCRIQQP